MVLIILFPEIFYIAETYSVAPYGIGDLGVLRALQFNPTTSTLQLLWQSPTLIPAYNQLAIARVPNTNTFIICGFYSFSQIFCSNAATGGLLSVQNLPYSFAGGYGAYAGLSINRLFQSSNDLFIIAPWKVFRFNSATGVITSHCNMPATSYNVILFPHAEDIDNDGVAEILYAHCIYSGSTCAQLWCVPLPVLPHAYSSLSSAVVNMDSDPQAEIVVVTSDYVVVSEHTGVVKWQRYIPSSPATSFGGGAPAIADFNGDGIPDVGVANQYRYYVLNGINGIPLKIMAVSDTSWFTSTSTFDFQDDGASEFLHCDDLTCRIISMNWVLSIPKMSGTASEYPSIADIDLDGRADVIVVGFGLAVINSLDSWAGADSTWTIHGFNALDHDPITNYPQVSQISNRFRSKPVARYTTQEYSGAMSQ